MTELERILKDTLTNLERDFSTTLTSQRGTLEAHSQALARLQEQTNRNSSSLREFERLLSDLSNVYRNLEPLLARLTARLNGEMSGQMKE